MKKTVDVFLPSNDANALALAVENLSKSTVLRGFYVLCGKGTETVVPAAKYILLDGAMTSSQSLRQVAEAATSTYVLGASDARG